MKSSELRLLSIDELQEKLQLAQEEQLRRRCNKAIEQLEDVSLIRFGRREIARIFTIIQEKRLQQKSA
ncbi:MAG: 50S ribosomal protein L29 [SAR324 cluster bacterium]|nr:50S ribosomal protein L29 [SAR324 cluster bacterium]